MTTFPLQLSICVYRCASVAILGLVLTACESDFVVDPARERPTRAVESPLDRNSAIGEVSGPATGAVPLVVVELPNKKDEQAKVRTILDPAEPPATAPASRPAADAPGTPEAKPFKVTEQSRPADQFAIHLNSDGTPRLTVTSPSGIGSVTLERTGESWPAVIHVALRYADERPFTRLESLAAGERVDAVRRVELKTTAWSNEGRVDVIIPGFARNQRITIDWVDAHR